MVRICIQKETRYSIAACTLATVYARIKRKVRANLYKITILHLPSLDINSSRCHPADHQEDHTSYNQGDHLLHQQPPKMIKFKMHKSPHPTPIDSPQPKYPPDPTTCFL